MPADPAQPLPPVPAPTTPTAALATARAADWHLHLLAELHTLSESTRDEQLRLAAVLGALHALNQIQIIQQRQRRLELQSRMLDLAARHIELQARRAGGAPPRDPPPPPPPPAPTPHSDQQPSSRNATNFDSDAPSQEPYPVASKVVPDEEPEKSARPHSAPSDTPLLPPRTAPDCGHAARRSSPPRLHNPAARLIPSVINHYRRKLLAGLASSNGSGQPAQPPLKLRLPPPPPKCRRAPTALTRLPRRRISPHRSTQPTPVAPDPTIAPRPPSIDSPPQPPTPCPPPRPPIPPAPARGPATPAPQRFVLTPDRPP